MVLVIRIPFQAVTASNGSPACAFVRSAANGRPRALEVWVPVPISLAQELNSPNGDPELQPEPDKPPVPAWLTSRRTRIALLTFAGVLVISLIVFTCFYVKFARLTNEKLRTGVFAGALNIFAEPRILAVGDRLSIADTVAYLTENGYGSAPANRVGRYRSARQRHRRLSGSQ